MSDPHAPDPDMRPDAETPAPPASAPTPPPPPPPPSATPPSPASGPPPPAAVPGSSDARTWAVAAHLSALVSFLGIPGVVGPLVVWLVKRDADPFIDDQGKEALNFNLSVLIYGVALLIGSVVIGVLTLGLGLLILVPVMFAVLIAWFVFVILAAVSASRGEAYRYPLTLRLIN